MERMRRVESWNPSFKIFEIHFKLIFKFTNKKERKRKKIEISGEQPFSKVRNVQCSLGRDCSRKRERIWALGKMGNFLC